MDRGTFTTYAALADLPTLVRQQRRLEAKIAPLGPFLDQEKAVRKVIDAQLVIAGILKGESVSCNGYDVTHVERAGQKSLNPDTIIDELVKLDLDRGVALRVLVDSTETGDPQKFCTVQPSKGAAVRAPVEQKRMATTTRPRKRATE